MSESQQPSPNGRTLAELAEAGLLGTEGAARTVLAATKRGMAGAREVPLRRAAYLAWVGVSAAFAGWILLFIERGAPESTFVTAVVVESAWFLGAVTLGYIHLPLVRREDGTPRRFFLLPNGLTLLRFSTAPLLGFAAMLAADLRPDAAFVFWPLVAVMASDLFDGQIARLCDMRSEWGRLADPFADIFAITWFTVGLWTNGAIEGWYAVPILVRYAGTLLAVFAVWGGGRPVKIEATVIGKVTNFSISFALPMFLGAAMMWPSWQEARWVAAVQYVTAGLIYANILYYVARLWDVAARRP